MPNKALVSPAKVSAPSPLRISLDTMKRNMDVDPSIVKPISAHHSDSVVYSDEVISIEDELKYPYPPYPHEQLPLFLLVLASKGHSTIGTIILFSFKRVRTTSLTPLNLLGFGLKNRLYFTLGSYMTATRYFLMSSRTPLL